MLRLLVLLFGLMLISATSTACHGPQAPATEPLDIQEDVPVPPQFKLREDISRAPENVPNFLRLAYERRGPFGIQRTADFYYQALEERGWTFNEDRQFPDRSEWWGIWSRPSEYGDDALRVRYRERVSEQDSGVIFSVIEIELNELN